MQHNRFKPTLLQGPETMNRSCWLLLLPVIITAAGLATAADWLLWNTPGIPGLPLGNAATWLALSCLAALVLLRRPRGLLRFSALLALLLSLGWGFVGYFLSGNWRFSVGEGTDGTIWWRLTIATTLLLLVNLAWSLFPRARKQ